MRTLYILIALVFSWLTYSQDFQIIQKLQSSDLETIKSKLLDLTGYKLAGEKAKGEYYLIALAPQNFTEQQIKEDKLNGYIECVLINLVLNSEGKYKLYEFNSKIEFMYNFAKIFFNGLSIENFNNNSDYRQYYNKEIGVNVFFYKNEETFRYVSYRV